jgi:hypothetical protein
VGEVDAVELGMLAIIHMHLHRCHTQALRIRWSSRLKYASYRKSPDSSIAFSLLFMAHRCSLPDGTGCDCFDSGDEGSMKGNEPLGDAWLFAGAIRKAILENLRYACDAVSWSGERWGSLCECSPATSSMLGYAMVRHELHLHR